MTFIVSALFHHVNVNEMDIFECLIPLYLCEWNISEFHFVFDLMVIHELNQNFCN